MLLALLDAGCEVDTADCSGYTPLMRAVLSGHTDCVQLLLQRGANVHVKKFIRVRRHTCPSRCGTRQQGDVACVARCRL